MKTNTSIYFLFTLGLLFLALGCGPDGSDILRSSDILDLTQTLLGETKESTDDKPESQVSVSLDTPDAVEITHYSDQKLTKQIASEVREGITVFTKVVFIKDAPYVVADDSTARPDIRYVLSRTDGSKVERRYNVVARGAADDFLSADCRPLEGTKVFVCKYTLPVSDFTEFSVNVLGIVLDGTSLKIDSKEVGEQEARQQPSVQQLTTPQGVSFERDLLPILRSRCAFAGCHVAGGPKNLDFSTYQSFLNGGDTGSVFVAGDAASSDIIEEIVSGRMPPGGPPLTDSQVQLFRDWINQQPSTSPPMRPQQPSTQQPQHPGNTTEPETSFNQNLLPILRERCAYSGCHDANGYDGLDFRTYQSFIRGDYEGESVFIPGNARSSDIIEEIVSGRMPLGGPRLSNAQIQLFRDWINQQDPADFPNIRYDDDDDDDDDEDDDDDDDDDDD